MNNNFDYTQSNNPNYMLSKINENYTMYFKASKELKIDTFFSLQSIYECMSQTGNYEEEQRIRALNKFIKYVNFESGINYALEKSNGFRVIIKPDSPLKQLIKRGRNQIPKYWN